MSTPIICLSKGRADPKLAKTLAQVEDLEVPQEFVGIFHVLVEPQDYEAYRAAFPRIRNWLVLPRDNPGLPFARQFALDHFGANDTAFWMIDDDISAFGFSNGKKVARTRIDLAFHEANHLIADVQGACALSNSRELGQAAMEYQQFSWSATKSVGYRGYCDVCVWINPKALPATIRYRPEMFKEDRDFTLQVLAHGLETARLKQIAFTCPKNGSNVGGLHDLYAKGSIEADCVDRMVMAWPGLVERQVKPDGRIDAKIHWKKAFDYYRGFAH